MRVLHVLETLAAGGVETTFLNVLTYAPRGMTHDVLAFAGGPLEPEFRAVANRVTVTRRTRDLERILDEGEYDVAYVLFERCAERLLPLLVARTTTSVIYGKNYDFSGQWRTTEGFQWSADDALMAACDGVTFTTRELAAGYADGERARGVVLGKGANVTPLLTIPPPSARTPNRILVIANPTPRKRLADLVAALALVRDCVPDAEVRVLGRGDATEEHRLRSLAVGAGVADAFTLAGVSRVVADELRDARIVALASGSEGVPTVLLEGMAAGRPVVTTDAGHVRAIVEDGVEGFITRIGDIHAMADRLTRLLRDPTLACDIGTRGRRRAGRHAVEAIASQLSALLATQATPPCSAA